MIKSNKKKIFIFVFFSILIISILSPFASNDFFRHEKDAAILYHIGSVVEAKKALDEGQFPIRTAPWQNMGFGNPWFQFYSPVFYTLCGVIYKFFSPQNPFVALKLVLWFCLLLGTIYFHRIVLFFTNSNIISIFSATAYVMSPYLLLNMFGRGAITEAAGQGIIPIVLYYSIRIFFSQKFNFTTMILTGMSWFVLLGVHLLTCFYFSLFFGMFLFCFRIINRIRWKQIIFVGYAYLYGSLLGCYYLAPVGLYSKKFTFSFLAHIDKIFSGYLFLTPLQTLLSFAPTSPMPLPGNGALQPEKKLYLSMGLPIYLGIFGIIFILLNKRNLLNRYQRTSAIILLIMFFVVFFLAWTPFNFWPIVPEILQIAQFTYRFFAQIMWIGTLLFAFTIFAFAKNRLDLRHAIVGIMIICLCTRSWITSQNVGQSIHIQEIIDEPKFYYGQSQYLIAAQAVDAIEQSKTIPVETIKENCTRKENKTICNISTPNGSESIVQLPVFYYPEMLNIKVNGQKSSYVPTYFQNYLTLAGVKLPGGNFVVESVFQGLPWANWVSVFAFIIGIVRIIWAGLKT